jgi:hypothetical protein
MALRIPQNQIVESKYTVGKEYLLLSTHKEYQGYYYELNNKIFAGKEFNTNAPEIVKITSDKVNPLLLNPNTTKYGLLSKIKLNNNEFNHTYFKPSEDEVKKGQVLRYFAKKVNSNPILIREINKETYNNLISDPLYITISIINYLIGDGEDTSNNYIFDFDDLNKAEEKIPGIKAFLDL